MHVCVSVREGTRYHHVAITVSYGGPYESAAVGAAAVLSAFRKVAS